ncbi:MAG: hypothetical protein DME02_03195 [Candidatus Rokuibacteriota bacterium]|nr:MAG: hypothetical protein DME02_03195 [Candidatus Rokubacteria bacterium]
MACRSVRQRRPHRDRTPLDVMDRVLDKGIVIEVGGGEPEASGIESSRRLALLTIDARVDIVIVGEQRTDASAR